MRLESTEDWVIGVLPLIVACLLLLGLRVTAAKKRWAWLVLTVLFGVAAVLRLVIPGVGSGPAAAFFFALSMVCLARYWKKPPPHDPTVKKEWTDADKEEFKRLMRKNGH